jgi:flavin-dependent dehydrogenase
MDDVIVVGAGPAGAVAAVVLARAGARVRLIDRAGFPRDKMCGDTVNPGTLAILKRLHLAAAVEPDGLRIDGMRLTGDRAAIDVRYPEGRYGLALLRRHFDHRLASEAAAAGAVLETRTTVRQLLAANGRGTQLGVVATVSGAERALSARVVIAADGRRSTLAFGGGVTRHPTWPSRFALGAYFEGVAGTTAFGEMHIRDGRYLGIAPLPGGASNVCLVRPWRHGDDAIVDPTRMLWQEIRRDPRLGERFADARIVTRTVVVGPLAVDLIRRPPPGLLLAGDAAGFIDPMTGDGLRFAVRGGELAAIAALRALEHGWTNVHDWLDAERRREFRAKWRFNRMLRALVAAPEAVRAGGVLARLAPSVMRAVVRHAGDCGIVS